jgi:hypothetical protein
VVYKHKTTASLSARLVCVETAEILWQGRDTAERESRDRDEPHVVLEEVSQSVAQKFPPLESK